jgi:hypothetical protein
MTGMRHRVDRTIMEACVSKQGLLKGSRTCSFIACWAIASNALGRPITLDEYADWWKDSERTAYRHQADFREVFPQYPNPQPIVDQAAVKQAALARGPNGVGSLPVSLVAA